MRNRFLSFSSAVLPLLLLSGCSWLGDVSSNMRVDTGLEPQNIDSNVRFRTTYYFRVLTGCRIEETKDSDHQPLSETPFRRRISGHFVPLNDSLFRFRMTGQAAALFNRVHFESGVLRKEQIDPFGSTVRYNEHTNTFTPVSADEARADATRHAMMQEIQQFRTLYRDLLADDTLEADHRAHLFTKLIAMIEDRLDQIKASRPQDAMTSTPNSGTAGTSPTDTELRKLAEKLGALESELEEARTQFAKTQNTLTEAKKKVVEIKTNLDGAKAALASSDPLTNKPRQNIETLTAELTAAEQAMNTAETNRNAAEELITKLTKQSKDVKATIANAHRELTNAQKATTTSLKTLKEKVEDLLKELGVASMTLPATSPAGACGGKPSKNKYYLLGPEGAKELDPNDRLLLALSVDSKPLISALQQLSNQKSHAGEEHLKTMEILLEERGRILDAGTVLKKAEKEFSQAPRPTESPKLKTLLEELRKPYVTSTVTVPSK